MTKNWIITGIGSGFGHEIARQVLERGDRVAGTVRSAAGAADLVEQHPDAVHLVSLDLTDTAAIRPAIDAAAAWLGGVDVVVSNAGYGLFGAAEEVTDTQIEHQLDTNLLGSIQVQRAALPHLRARGGGRLIQLSSIAGLAAFPGASMYHASKWGIEGFTEALAGEVAGFGIGVTLVEPGGARTGFNASGLQWAPRMPEYDDSPIAQVRAMLQGTDHEAEGDPERMAAAMIATVDAPEPPLRLVLGAGSWAGATASLSARLAAIEGQRESAAAADFPA